MKPRGGAFKKREPKEFDERVLEVARVSRVVKGGRRIRFRATVAIGDHKGRVGIGIGKATEVGVAVQKATAKAKKNLVTIPIINGTIPYEIIASYGAARVMLKPASSGSSIVAGGAVRSIIELSGITDIMTKILGSRGLINNATAVINGLTSFKPSIVEQVRNFNVVKTAKTVETAGTVEIKKVVEPQKTVKKAIKKTVKK